MSGHLEGEKSEGYMNILEERFAVFKMLPIEEKIECFQKDGRLFDMIISNYRNIGDRYGSE